MKLGRSAGAIKPAAAVHPVAGRFVALCCFAGELRLPTIQRDAADRVTRRTAAEHEFRQHAPSFTAAAASQSFAAGHSAIWLTAPLSIAKVRETVWATGREVVGVGTYEQAGGGSGRFNLQITMHDGDGQTPFSTDQRRSAGLDPDGDRRQMSLCGVST